MHLGPIWIDSPFTYLHIGLLVLVFIASMGNPNIVGNLLLDSRYRKQRYRLFTHALVHSGPMHLLFNGLTLYFFGPTLESLLPQPFGALAACLVFWTAVLGAGQYSLLFRRNRPVYLALGASGGVVGCIYFLLFLAPDLRLSLLFLPVAIPGWLFGTLFGLVSTGLMFSKKAELARVSHEGHLGGAAVGLLWALLLNSHALGQDPIRLGLLIGGALVAPLLALVYKLYWR